MIVSFSLQTKGKFIHFLYSQFYSGKLDFIKNHDPIVLQVVTREYRDTRTHATWMQLYSQCLHSPVFLTPCFIDLETKTTFHRLVQFYSLQRKKKKIKSCPYNGMKVL